MGWLELQTWLREMNRQRRPRDVDPDSWQGREQDTWWREQDEARRRARGW